MSSIMAQIKKQILEERLFKNIKWLLIDYRDFCAIIDSKEAIFAYKILYKYKRLIMKRL